MLYSALSQCLGCAECISQVGFSCLLQNFPCFLHGMDPNIDYDYVSGFHYIRMSITWQEREHEEQDMVSLNNPGTFEALRNFRLLKYFKLSGMRQKIELL